MNNVEGFSEDYVRFIEDFQNAKFETLIFGFDGDGPVPQWYDENIGTQMLIILLDPF